MSFSTQKIDIQLYNLRKKLTVLSCSVSSLILFIILLMSLFITETQLKNSSEKYMQGTLNSVCARLQSEDVINHDWLAHLEASDDMIISIIDGGTPLIFSGVWKPETERSVLFTRAEQEAKKQGLLIDTRPISVIEPQTTVFNIKGDFGDSYIGGAATVADEKGWQAIIILKDRSSEIKQILITRISFVVLIVLGICLLMCLCWLISGQTIKPIKESRKKQVEFVAAASHELRTPLAVITTSSSALTASQPTDKILVNTIQKECSRMSRLVDDLLTLSRSDTGNWSASMGTVDLDTLLIELTDKFITIAAKKDQILTLKVPDCILPNVYGDAQRLEQILTILLDNACSYTQNGGKIQIITSFNEKYVTIKVKDNGCGIQKEHRKHIFDRFYRVDKSRTGKEHFGLGLSIAKELAMLHGGKLYLENNTDLGASFVLELPRKT